MTQIAFSKSGQFVGVASADSTLSIWRTNDGTLRVWVLHDGSPVLIIEDERIQGYIHDIDIADDSGAVAVLTPTGALLIDPNRPFARVLR